jgi:hypothetical protein
MTTGVVVLDLPKGTGRRRLFQQCPYRLPIASGLHKCALEWITDDAAFDAQAGAVRSARGGAARITNHVGDFFGCLEPL